MVSARIPPKVPRTVPRINPPIPSIPITEKTIVMIPHICEFEGFLLIIMPDIMTIKPDVIAAKDRPYSVPKGALIITPILSFIIPPIIILLYIIWLFTYIQGELQIRETIPPTIIKEPPINASIMESACDFDLIAVSDKFKLICSICYFRVASVTKHSMNF